MTPHEIFEYLMFKYNVRNNWPIDSKVELGDDEHVNAKKGSTANIIGYALIRNELFLNVQWDRPTEGKYGGNSGQQNGSYSIEIFKPIK